MAESIYLMLSMLCCGIFSCKYGRKHRTVMFECIGTLITKFRNILSDDNVLNVSK